LNQLGFQLPNYKIPQLPNLFNFLMRRMLPAPPAELLQLQPVRGCFAVLGLRIVPLFAIAALQRNDLSGHKNKLLAIGFWLLVQPGTQNQELTTNFSTRRTYPECRIENTELKTGRLLHSPTE
jgi:hypothetical protein